MYYCSIEAPGDTTGDSDREVRLIVYREFPLSFPAEAFKENAKLRSVLLSSCFRLAHRPVHHHRRIVAHYALLHMLLSVLPTKVLLLCPLSLLSSDLLLS